MSSAASGSQKNQTSASSRDHNQGRQDRAHTPAQLAAVNRVRKCKVTDYYAILDIESPSSDVEVRKAYRKLALIMHPDKNGAPGADEAFKMVSKAFQVLSDADKKRIFDQTGADPDGGPGGGAGGGAGASPFAGFSNFNRTRGPAGFAGGAEVSPEDLFNMFFGGGGGFGGGAFGGGPFGAQGFGFGPGVRVHSFGGMGPNAFYGARGGGGGGDDDSNRGRRDNEDVLHSLVRIVPLLLLFVLPMIFSLFGDSTHSVNSPRFKFDKVDPFVEERFSHPHHVPYFVNPQDTNLQQSSQTELKALDRRADVYYIRDLKNKCNSEMDYKQQKIQDAQGWLFVDVDAYEEARNMPLKSCDALERLGVGYR